MDWDDRAPLARVKGESRKANQALWDYAQMGAGRSLRKLHRGYQEVERSANESGSALTEEPPTRFFSTIAGWSTRYSWVDRVDAWTRLQKEEEAAEWEEHRREYRERAYKLAGQALDRVEAMLEFPLARRVVIERDPKTDQETVVEIQPMSWTLTSAAKLLAEANKAARLALGEATENTEARVSGQVVATTLSELEDDQLNDRIERLLATAGAPEAGDLALPPLREAPPAEDQGDPETDG